MLRPVFFAAVIVNLMGCGTTDTQSRKLTSLPTPLAPPTLEEHSAKGGVSDVDLKKISADNKAAHQPTFGVIRGYYQLPRSHLNQRAIVAKSRGYLGESEVIYVENSDQAQWAVTPMSAGDAEAMNRAYNALLDQGVKFVDVTMADATKIMQAEKTASTSNDTSSLFVPSRSLPSGVDLLISLQRGKGEYGDIYIGRVIRTTDGSLLAMRTAVDASPATLDPVVVGLVSDSLRRIAGTEKE